MIIIGGRGRLVQRLPKVDKSCSRENAQDLLSKFKLISPILFCRSLDIIQRPWSLGFAATVSSTIFYPIPETSIKLVDSFPACWPHPIFLIFSSLSPSLMLAATCSHCYTSEVISMIGTVLVRQQVVDI